MNDQHDDIISVTDYSDANYSIDLNPHSVMWSAPSWSTDTVTISSDGLSTTQVDSNLSVNGDIVLNGRSLSDRLDKIEDRLNILRPSPELEAEWKELAALRKQYEELEKQLAEKQHMWDQLKKEY